MTRIVLAAALLICVPIQALGGVKISVELALDSYWKGYVDRAASIAQIIVDKDPKDTRAQYILGEARLALGEFAKAEAAFRACLAVKAESVPALSGLGRALTAQGKAGEAEPHLRKAIDLDSKDATGKRALGEALAAQGKGDEARKTLESAVDLDRKDPQSARSLVEFLLKRGDLGPAMEVATRLKKELPGNPMGPFLCGLVLDRDGKDDEAIQSYEAALKMDPKFIDAHKNVAALCISRSSTYQNRQRVEKAFLHAEKYFALGGKDEELKQTMEAIRKFLKESGLLGK